MPSTNISWDIAIAAGFLLGLALFVVSSAMLRATSREARQVPAQPDVTWPLLVDEELTHTDRTIRLDMIERLSLVPGDWSRDILQRARGEETDPQIVAALEDALDRV